MPVETRAVQQAYKFALDPTPQQARMLASHAGAKRYAFNFANALIMTAADARRAQKDAGEELTTPIPRQMKTPDHPGVGVLWTRFKNTAVGCRTCRRLLARDPASGSPWADARTGSVTCDPAALERLGISGEPGHHDPTSVKCDRCQKPLHETPEGTWADAAFRAMAEVAREIRLSGIACPSCGTSAADLPDGHALATADGSPGRYWAECRDGRKVSLDGAVLAGGEAAAAGIALYDDCRLRMSRPCPGARKPGAPHEPSSEFTAWTGDVFSGTVQAAHRDADTAWQRFLGGKARRPRFKKKGKCAESFQVHGDGLRITETLEVPRRAGPRSGKTVRQQTAAHITLPKIGPVRVLSDDSLHPAMRRSRRRASPGHERHMGNRRRFRQLRRHMRKSDEKAAALGPLLRQARADAGWTLEQAVARLGAEADARAVAAVRARLAAAEDALAAAETTAAAAGDAEAAAAAATDRRNAQNRIKAAQKKLQSLDFLSDVASVFAREPRLWCSTVAERLRARSRSVYADITPADVEKQLRGRGVIFVNVNVCERSAVDEALSRAEPGEKAARTDRWSADKLAKLEATGAAQGLDQVGVICSAYGLNGELREKATDLAAQARIIRASITLGADGLWWCSVGAEVPHAVRTAPSKRQAARGTAGIDFGTARVITVTGRRPVRAPAYYERELAALGAAQRHAARTVPGSARHAKAKAKAGLIHADIARLRAGSLQRATTSLSRNFSVLSFEGFNVQQMMRDGSQGLPRRARGRRNRSLADAGIGMARDMLRHKGPRYGATVVTLGPDAITITGPGPEDAREADLPPDARPNGTCSGCGQAKTKPARPRQALYCCDACGRVRLRTLNSAENIRRWADEALTAEPGCATSGPDQSRGGDEPVTAGLGAGRSPVKRAAITSSRPRRGEAGIPGG